MRQKLSNPTHNDTENQIYSQRVDDPNQGGFEKLTILQVRLDLIIHGFKFILSRKFPVLRQYGSVWIIPITKPGKQIPGEPHDTAFFFWNVLKKNSTREKSSNGDRSHRSNQTLANYAFTTHLLADQRDSPIDQLMRPLDKWTVLLNDHK